MTRDEARKISTWTDEYLAAQDKARKLVDCLTFSQRDDMREGYNAGKPRNLRIKSDGGLIRNVTVDILAGIDVAIPPDYFADKNRQAQAAALSVERGRCDSDEWSGR